MSKINKTDKPAKLKCGACDVFVGDLLQHRRQVHPIIIKGSDIKKGAIHCKYCHKLFASGDKHLNYCKAFRDGEGGVRMSEEDNSYSTESVLHNPKDVQTESNCVQSKQPELSPFHSKEIRVQSKTNHDQSASNSVQQEPNCNQPELDSNQPELSRIQLESDTLKSKTGINQEMDSDQELDSNQEMDSNQLDSNRLESDSNQLELDSNPLVSDSNQQESDSNQLESDSNQLELDSNQLESDSNQLESDSNRLELVSNQLESNSNQPKLNSSEPESNSNQTESVSNELESASYNLTQSREISEADPNTIKKGAIYCKFCQKLFASGDKHLNYCKAFRDGEGGVRMSDEDNLHSTQSDSNQPELNSNQPESDSNHSKLDSNQSKLDSNQPEMDSNQPGLDRNQAESDSYQTELNSAQASNSLTQSKETSEAELDTNVQMEPTDATTVSKIAKYMPKKAPIHLKPKKTQYQPKDAEASTPSPDLDTNDANPHWMINPLWVTVRDEVSCTCQYCEEVFASRAATIDHENKHVVGANTEEEEVEKKPPKFLKCLQCDKIIGNRKRLCRHMTFFHKNWYCCECGKEYSSKSKVLDHFRYRHDTGPMQVKKRKEDPEDALKSFLHSGTIMCVKGAGV